MRSPACTDPRRSILRVQSSRRIFTVGFRSWPPVTCRFSSRRSFDHHGKGNGYYREMEFRKMKKKWNLLVSLNHLIVMKRFLPRDCLWLCQACKHGRRPTEKFFRQDPHSYRQTDICSAPYSDHDSTVRVILPHTSLWSSFLFVMALGPTVILRVYSCLDLGPENR